MFSPDLTRRPRTKRRFSDADMARMRDLYCDRDTPVTKVAGAFGVPVSTFLRWIAEMDWPRRTSSGPGGGRDVWSPDLSMGASTPNPAQIRTADLSPNPSPQGGGESAPHSGARPQSGRGAGPLPVNGEREAVSVGPNDLPSAGGGREKPFDVNELAYEVAAAARGQLQSLGDVAGPMTLDERQRRADIIASLSRSIARVDRTFERRIERAKLQREVKTLRERLGALENPHLAEVERLTVEAMQREIERSKARRG